MAGHGHGDSSGQGMIVGINVTPLVDIMLVLLVIFIVTAKIIVAPAVPLDLPKASKTEEEQQIFKVTVPESGPTFVNATPIADDAALAAMTAAALAQDPELRVVLDADGSVPHRKVIHTLDIIRAAGVRKVAFGALPEGEAGK